jgi:hypothetical protein
MTRFIQVWSTITIIDASEQFHLHFKVGLLLPHTLGYRGVNFGTTFDQHKRFLDTCSNPEWMLCKACIKGLYTQI